MALVLLGPVAAFAGPRPLAVAAPQASPVADQPAATIEVSEPRSLGIDDYERWRRITASTLSNDGEWVSYGFRKSNAVDPEPLLIIRSLRDEREFEIPEASGLAFSDDSRWAAFFVDLPFDEAARRRASREPRPRSVRLLDLDSGAVATFDNAASFRFASGSGFLAVQRARPEGQRGRNAPEGADLILRDLAAGADMLIGSVGEFAFNDRDRSFVGAAAQRSAASLLPADRLAYTVDAADRVGNGLYLFDLHTRAHRTLDNGALVYSRLTWDGDGVAVAVLKGERPGNRSERVNALVAITDPGTDAAARTELDPGASDDFPAGMVLSERGELAWSPDRSRLFVGLRDQTEVPDEPEYPDRIANVDVWHWQDERIQSVQMAQAERERNFTYRAAVSIPDGEVVRLTDAGMRQIEIARDGRWGVGRDARAYVSDWKEIRADYYRVDTTTGERALVLEGQGRTMGLSPDGQQYLFWRDGHLWLWDLESGATRNLTASAPVSFVDAEYDHPDTPPPYGIAGWTADGDGLILEHRYDLWHQPLDGSAATDLTGGRGERDEIRFRIQDTDPDALTVDLTQPLLLSSYGQWTKRAGFHRLVNGRFEELVFEDRRFGRPVKARDADVYVYSRETFTEFPDLWVGDGAFAAPRRLTEANPWQTEYRWGRRILFDYENDDGQRLQGTLAIPDDYVPGERRPMIVNFYEKSSQNLHRHLPPSYVTGFGGLPIEALGRGYLLMQADIHFRGGNTHADMLECVEAATRKVIEMGYADPARIGLNGHSFSGQGSAYIAGRSRMFAAVASGAAATNLEADFNHMWGWTPTNKNGTGTNAHRYDYWGQGRLGTNPYDDPELYRSESATTYARTIETPLLMMHGDDDGVVAVMEALQMYNGMRFNGNEIIVLTYPGEGHGLRNRANRRDLTIRLMQWWNHHLRGEPAPSWMVDGVPFTDKEHGAWSRGAGR